MVQYAFSTQIKEIPLKIHIEHISLHATIVNTLMQL